MAILGATNPLGNQTLVRNVVEGYPDVRLPLATTIKNVPFVRYFVLGH
jgi:hypothetical protein